MATPRKRYFRVADSILREPWPADVKLAVIQLMAYLNQRWARDGLTAEEACRATLGPADVQLISGKRRRDVAETLLERCADVVSMSVQRSGDVVEIHWPKFSEFQGFESDSRAKSGRKSPPPRPRPASATREREEAPTQEPSAAENRDPTLELEACPERLTEEQREEVRAFALEHDIPAGILPVEWKKFRLRRRSEGKLYTDWAAAFQDWLLRGKANGLLTRPDDPNPFASEASKRLSSESADAVLDRQRRLAEEDDARFREAAEDGSSRSVVKASGETVGRLFGPQDANTGIGAWGEIPRAATGIRDWRTC